MFWLRCFGCFVLLCIYDLNPASRAASVAQLIRVSPRKRMVVGSSPPKAADFY